MLPPAARLFIGYSKIPPYYIWWYSLVSQLRTLGTRRYTTYGITGVPPDAARRDDGAREEVQAVGAGRRAGDRGPIVPVVARAVQVVSRDDVTGADKEQRGSGNGISTTTSRASKAVLIEEVIETTRNCIVGITT